MKQLDQSWREILATIPDEIPIESRRFIRHAFFCGAAAYVRGLERAQKEAADRTNGGDALQMAQYIVEQATEMQREILDYAAKAKDHNLKMRAVKQT